MGVKRLEELRAFTAAVAFKLEVYRIAREAPGVQRDLRFRSQLFDAAASVEVNIAEGWRRHSAADFCRFLKYARASLEEAQRWLCDGADRGYYSRTSIVQALDLADQCARNTMALWRSLQQFTGTRDRTLDRTLDRTRDRTPDPTNRTLDPAPGTRDPN